MLALLLVLLSVLRPALLVLRCAARTCLLRKTQGGHRAPKAKRCKEVVNEPGGNRDLKKRLAMYDSSCNFDTEYSQTKTVRRHSRGAVGARTCDGARGGPTPAAGGAPGAVPT